MRGVARHSKWGVFPAHVTDDGRVHVAPMDTDTLGPLSPHELAEHCGCDPRVREGLVVHNTVSAEAIHNRLAALARRGRMQ